jgi:fluoride exporter
MVLSKYLYVALGGALGSIARYWVGASVAGRAGSRFPWGTLIINITACVLLGFTMTWLTRRTAMNPGFRFLVPIGFIGAYSTFSTYEWEAFSTMRAGAFALAAVYIASSVVLGLAATWGGSALAEVLADVLS